MKAIIKIKPKQNVLDPQGKAIKNALTQLHFSGVEDVRQGKLIEIRLIETNPTEAKKQVEKMCKTLLANLVIEDYEISLEETKPPKNTNRPEHHHHRHHHRHNSNSGNRNSGNSNSSNNNNNSSSSSSNSNKPKHNKTE